MYKNIFYFRKISKIGGTEQFLFEIAKKYKNYDITIFYDEADLHQLKRLRQLVRCKKRIKGEVVKCNRAFFNFNLDMINDVEANEYYFVSHANYEELGYKPPIEHPKLTHYIGVSQFASDKLCEYGKKLEKEIKTITCYNPLTLESREKVLHLVSACRLDDKVKGGNRTIKLIKALDNYCKKTGRHYIWTIFSNNTKIEIDSPNVVFMKSRVDVRPYIADADYVLQLSNDMETYCYTINEALGYGVPVVTTPLSILNELPITDNEHIVLDWDCRNVEEVAKSIFEKEVKPFEYKVLKDNWSNLLVEGKSTYKEELEMVHRVKATEMYRKYQLIDAQLGFVPAEGYEFEVSDERFRVLNGDNSYGCAFVTEVKGEKPKAVENKVEENKPEETPANKKAPVKETAVKKVPNKKKAVK